MDLHPKQDVEDRSPPPHERTDRDGLPVLPTNVRSRFREGLFYDDWGIGIAEVPAAQIPASGLPEIRWLPRPRRRLVMADPFFVNWEGEELVLCEVYDYRMGKGRIGGFSLISPTAIRIVLDLPVHASFPFPVVHEGKLYCIPETVGLGEVAIYDISDLSHPRKAGVLLEQTPGCDCVIVHHGSRWWMFGTDARDGPFDKLRIWHADDLFGPWQSHGVSPVKTDAASARSAGPLFLADGMLHRPAQDCSETYGRRVVIHRVTQLSTDAFEEEPVRILEPDRNGPYPDGLHTVSSGPGWVLVDGKNVRSVFSSWLVLSRRATNLLRRRRRTPFS